MIDMYWVTCFTLMLNYSAAIYAKNLILIKQMSMTGYFDNCCEMIVWHPSGHNYSDEYMCILIIIIWGI